MLVAGEVACCRKRSPGRQSWDAACLSPLQGHWPCCRGHRAADLRRRRATRTHDDKPGQGCAGGGPWHARAEQGALERDAWQACAGCDWARGGVSTGARLFPARAGAACLPLRPRRARLPPSSGHEVGPPACSNDLMGGLRHRRVLACHGGCPDKQNCPAIPARGFSNWLGKL